MDRNWALEALWVTESAAIAAARQRGFKDKMEADRVATEAMRNALNLLNMRGTVRIGEGEMDEAPMLYIGERLGTWADDEPLIDIAVDPLDCTLKCAENGPGSMTTLAFAEDGGFLNAPDMYMEKLVVGPEAKGAIDIRRGVTWNLDAIARAKGVNASDLTAIILDRERHLRHIEEIRKAGAYAHLISDGDIGAAIATIDPSTGIDVLFGSGGAPEGVLAAAALRSAGGGMQGILIPEDEAQARRAVEMTKRPIDHVYAIDELAGGHVMFAATGVTDGPVFKGVRFYRNGTVETHSIVTRSRTGSFRWIRKVEPLKD